MADPVWIAIENDDKVAIEDLLDRGLDTEAKRLVGRESLLQYAYMHKSKKVFKLLAERNAGIEVELVDGTRMIHIAAYDEDPFWLDALIGAGAELDAWSNGRGNREGTPIHFSIIENCQDNGLRLLKAGACIDCPSNQFHSTAFYHAANFGRWRIATQMLKLGADPMRGRKGKRVVDTLKQLNLDSSQATMVGFSDFARELAKQGLGKEVFAGSLWTGKTYEEHLLENE